MSLVQLIPENGALRDTSIMYRDGAIVHRAYNLDRALLPATLNKGRHAELVVARMRWSKDTDPPLILLRVALGPNDPDYTGFSGIELYSYPIDWTLDRAERPTFFVSIEKMARDLGLTPNMLMSIVQQLVRRAQN